MKSSLTATILAITSSIAMAAPTIEAAHPNFVFMNDTEAVAAVGQMCFQFEAVDNLSGFYYTFQPPWGSNSGHAGKSGSICVPTSNSAGGAMFIGPNANPGPGSTKLECFFPTSGTANCDMSLVNGYSSAVSCEPGTTGEVFGGGSLLNSGIHCPDQQGVNCINANGQSAAAQSDIGPFFQVGVQGKNEYCIWENCDQDFYFATGDKIECLVGK